MSSTASLGRVAGSSPPHIQPFIELRSAVDGGGGYGSTPPQLSKLAVTPHLAQTKSSLSVGNSNRAPSNNTRARSNGHAGQQQPQSSTSTDMNEVSRVDSHQPDLERAGSRRRGQVLSEEQIHRSLETVRRNLDALTEQLSNLQGGARGVEVWDPDDTTMMQLGGTCGGEAPPAYESPILTSQRGLPDP